MVHIRQSRLDSGRGLQVKVLGIVGGVPCLLDYSFDPPILFESASTILYVAEKEVQDYLSTPQDPTVGLCLGS